MRTVLHNIGCLVKTLLYIFAVYVSDFHTSCVIHSSICLGVFLAKIGNGIYLTRECSLLYNCFLSLLHKFHTVVVQKLQGTCLELSPPLLFSQHGSNHWRQWPAFFRFLFLQWPKNYQRQISTVIKADIT